MLLVGMNAKAVHYSKTEQKAKEVIEFYNKVEALHDELGRDITVEELESRIDRRLTGKEKKFLKYYNKQEKEEKVPGDGAALFSLLSGAVGWLSVLFAPILFFILMPAAIVAGVIALGTYKRNGKKGKNYGLGLAGLILGGVGVLLFLVALISFANGGWW